MQEKSAATGIVLRLISIAQLHNHNLSLILRKKMLLMLKKIANAYHGSNCLTFMPVREGLVGKMRVYVLRDSGCNSILIKDKLVEAKEYTEKKVTCILADILKPSSNWSLFKLIISDQTLIRLQ